MDRRGFFRRIVNKTAESALKEAERRVSAKAARWIRPPFARAELDFMLLCTRCDACIQACDPGVIFALPMRVGAEVAGTPALDLLNKACHLCTDWPCVAACEPKALSLPEDDPEQAAPTLMPLLARVEIDEQLCLPYQGPECGACAVCPIPGALIFSGTRPRIEAQRCVGCALCREACITEPKAVKVRALQGVQEDEDGSAV